MLHSVQPDRFYCPETISVMTAALDKACQSVTEQMKGNDEIKQTLALIILRHVDRGERDPERLAETAFREWRAPTVQSLCGTGQAAVITIYESLNG